MIWQSFKNTVFLIRMALDLATVSTVGWFKMAMLKQGPYSGDALVTAWAKRLLKAAHVSVTIHNPHKTKTSPTKPTIVMVNHSSLFDIPLSFVAFPERLRMMGKRVLFKVPIWGHASKLAGHIPVDRSNPRKAAASLLRAKRALQDGIILWMAPEGTRSTDGKLLPFKLGGFKLAIDAGADIIPVAIKGADAIIAKHSLTINHGQSVDVTIGTAIDASQFSKQTIEQLVQQVRNQIEQAL